MDGGARWAADHGVAESARLSDSHFPLPAQRAPPHLLLGHLRALVEDAGVPEH